ncbi:GNAT family N-acetyltransferase [Rubripirellula obstinata]|uniref:GNAT family N-acetyltransferase n=1 Tax=Rubripirellula obstinata TaxID=406547 RepID=UPI00082EF465|nr:GNAT family N-acetyltransferase [Rubripirellula obstinata]
MNDQTIRQLAGLLLFEWPVRPISNQELAPPELLGRVLELSQASSTASIVLTDSEIELAGLSTPSLVRRQGGATLLVQRICQAADETNLNVVLRPQAFGDVTTDNTWLMAFYAKFGFTGDDTEMRRTPGSTEA